MLQDKSWEMAKRMLVETGSLCLTEKFAERLSLTGNAQNFIRLFKKHMEYYSCGQYRGNSNKNKTSRRWILMQCESIFFFASDRSKDSTLMAVFLHGDLVKADGLERGGARADAAEVEALHAVDHAADGGEITQILLELGAQRMHDMGLEDRERDVVLTETGIALKPAVTLPITCLCKNVKTIRPACLFYTRSLIQELHDRKENYVEMSQNLLENLLYLIRREIRVTPEAVSVCKTSQECRMIEQYINAHYAETITLDTLSALTFHSKYYAFETV